MLISELEAKLKELREEHGDLNVLMDTYLEFKARLTIANVRVRDACGGKFGIPMPYVSIESENMLSE